MKKIFTLFRILLQVSTDFLSIWQQYGLNNVFRLFLPLLLKQKVISVRHSEGIFYYHLEQYRRVTLNQIVHSYPSLKKQLNALPPLSSSSPIIFDLGANCGHFSLLARYKYPQSTIYAFEPSPYLKPILATNFYNQHIILDQRAVSNQTGELNFYINPAGQQTNSLLKDSVTPFNQEKHLEILTVKTETLDKICEEYNIKEITLLKIDCQGAEYLILKGGQKILTRTQFVLLELSFLDSEIFSMIAELRALFPYYKVIDSVSYGANILLAKQPL